MATPSRSTKGTANPSPDISTSAQSETLPRLVTFSENEFESDRGLYELGKLSNTFGDSNDFSMRYILIERSSSLSSYSR